MYRPATPPTTIPLSTTDSGQASSHRESGDHHTEPGRHYPNWESVRTAVGLVAGHVALYLQGGIAYCDLLLRNPH